MTRSRPTATFLLSTGLVVISASIVLYATSLSRAIAGWVSPLGVALALTGLWTLRTGQPPHRAILLGMGLGALALLVLGLWTLAVALQAEERPS